MFSYKDYVNLISIVKKLGVATNFRDSIGEKRFCILRHDVEFSVDRAYDLAKLEQSMGVNSTFFFQISNNTYNLFSQKNISMVREINEMGNDVGLHFHLNGLSDIVEIKDRILLEMDVLGKMLGNKIDMFSIHRPTKAVLAANIKFDGIINAYQDDFFSFVENVDVENTEIKYFSDAQHRWNYGLFPNEQTLNMYDKIQILTHPYSWTKQGYDNLGNFKSLIDEKNLELINSIDTECKHFARIKDEL